MMATPTRTMFSCAIQAAEARSISKRDRITRRCITTSSAHKPGECALGAGLRVFHRRRQRFQSASGEDFAEVLQQFFVDEAVRGQHLAAVQAKGCPVKASDGATRLLHDKHAGGGVPRVQVEFPKAVVASRRDVREVESRRSRPSHTVRAKRELLVKVNV